MRRKRFIRKRKNLYNKRTRRRKGFKISRYGSSRGGIRL